MFYLYIYDKYNIMGEGYKTKIVVSFLHCIWSGKTVTINTLKKYEYWKILRATTKNMQRYSRNQNRKIKIE